MRVSNRRSSFPPATAAQRVLVSRAGGGAALDRGFYRLYDTDAVEHLFKVACALDSQMVGEAQILGQVKAAVQASEDAGMIAPPLDRLVQTAYQLAKRVRTSTRIGEGAVSVAAAAVRVAQDVHGDISRCRALLIGLGETGALMADQFKRSGLGTMDMTGPSRRTAREAARRNHHFIPFEELEDALVNSDIVVTASGHGRYLTDRAVMDRVVKARRHKPILLLDCGIPRDIDPDVDAVEDAFLYTLQDVERLAQRGQMDRKAEAAEAGEMVRAAVADRRRVDSEREVVAGLVALRRHFEVLRDDVLAKHPNADNQEITRLLINRLLHEPSEALRAIASAGADADLKDTITVNRVLSRLFDIDTAGAAKTSTGQESTGQPDTRQTTGGTMDESDTE